MQSEALVQSIVDQVKRVEGVQAIVLGGSRARGTHTSASDIDLGIYYHPNTPLNIPRLQDIASRLDDRHEEGLVTEIGDWGPWINGGGWLRVRSQAVDLLYRDLAKVIKVIDDCLEGKVEIDYQPGHPYGFVSAIYLAEVAVCRPLWNPTGVIQELKSKTDPYPGSLQKTLIQRFGWEIDFSLQLARKSIERADVAYAAGCCFRSVMCMIQVLFAINGEYWLNEKGAVALASTFAVKPAGLKPRVEEAFRVLDADPESIQQATTILQGLNEEIDLLIAAQ